MMRNAGISWGGELYEDAKDGKEVRVGVSFTSVVVTFAFVLRGLYLKDHYDLYEAVFRTSPR